MTNKKKVFVFGIDGASPELIFNKWLDELPNIRALIKKGCHARLNSTIPPSTIIAWNSMFSGKDASEIGVFSYTYTDSEGKSRLANSSLIKTKLVWDILSEQNKKSAVLYVPLSYPAKPLNGVMVTDFMTPNINSPCAYPDYMKEKLKTLKNPEIFFDVAVGLAGHKSMELDDLLEKTYEMTEMQLNLLKDTLINEDWDFFATVMIGTDRLQHMLWRHFDETHRRFIKDSPYKNALKDYYKYLDKQLGEILKLLDEDTTIIVTSDHGMIKQEGKININNWLIQEGYLVLKEGINSHEKRRFSVDLIDQDKTLVYGGGAYNARIYINKEKLGPNYEKFKNELIEKIKNIPDDHGNKLDTKIYSSEDIYKNPLHPECPDLTVYFDNLRWASNPDFGQEGIYSWETAVGADSAGHSRQGSFIICGKDIEEGEYLAEIDLRQIAPTILKLLDAKIPSDIQVQPLNVFKPKDFFEATLIDTTDGMQFKVYSSSHPKGFVIAKPKYIPESLLPLVGMRKRFILEKCMNRFNFFTKKEIVEENLKRMRASFPEYIYDCDKHKNWFVGVPVNKIKKVHDSRQGLKELMKVPDSDLDPYLKAAKGFITLLLESGVNLNNLGISHSTLLGNYTPGKSDIDVLVYGKENGWKAVNYLEKSQHPLLKWKSKEDWAKYYKDRVVSDQYNEEEYVFNMVRKKDDGFFDGNVFSVFCVEESGERWYDWEALHEPIGTSKIRAEVTEHYNSIVRPGFYEITNVQIIDGPKVDAGLIKRIVTWARPFNLQAKKGEKVEVCGLLEKIKSKEGEYYQIVLGYSDTYNSERGKQEYMKALLA